MPINASIKYFVTEDDLSLFYQHWIPENIKALLIFVHDFGGNINCHGSLVKYFAQRNYAVALYDQRGHGNSEGKKGDAEDFGHFVRDLSNFTHFSRSEVQNEIPIFLIGLGFGAQIIINLLVPAWHAVSWNGVNPGKINGFVTLSAPISPIINIPNWKLKMIDRIGKLFPTLPIDTAIKLSDIISNEEVVSAFENDPMINSKISFRLQKQIIENSQLIMAMASRVQIPALMMHGDNDTVAHYEGTREFFSRLPSNAKQLYIYEECLHDLTNELQNEKIFNDIERWIEDVKRLPAERDIPRTTKENICELLPMPF